MVKSREKRQEEMEGRRKKVACERETVSGRDKDTVGMREMLDL